MMAAYLTARQIAGDQFGEAIGLHRAAILALAETFNLTPIEAVRRIAASNAAGTRGANTLWFLAAAVEVIRERRGAETIQ